MRTRFAPSPTGDLHFGGAFTALASWWFARSRGGATVLRVEDLDRPRVVAGSEERQREDLAWLGLDWDEGPGSGGPVGPYRQTERNALYEEAMDALASEGRTYLCDCSRAEIARVASAPHEGEEVVYPGTCRDLCPTRPMRRPPATRLRVEPRDDVSWVDGVLGAVDVRVLRAGGDFVLRRADGVFAYQLAVAVDDLAMGITDVVRGDDLVASTPRQILLMQLWRHAALPWAVGAPAPRYWHLPLVRAADGSRLAKRGAFTTVRDVRAAGVAAERVIGQLGHALGIVSSPDPVGARELARRAPPGATFQATPWVPPSRWT